MSNVIGVLRYKIESAVNGLSNQGIIWLEDKELEFVDELKAEFKDNIVVLKGELEGRHIIYCIKLIKMNVKRG